jgi:hypothetical protein
MAIIPLAAFAVLATSYIFYSKMNGEKELIPNNTFTASSAVKDQAHAFASLA